MDIFGGDDTLSYLIQWGYLKSSDHFCVLQKLERLALLTLNTASWRLHASEVDLQGIHSENKDDSTTKQQQDLKTSIQ